MASATVTKIWHPGIQNEYLFDSWEEAERRLEEMHGGLASGMLANCVELTVTDLADRLEEAGIENRGREWNNTLLNERQNGVETLRLEPDMGESERAELEFWMERDPDRWARWFYTDAAGEPSLLCWAPWDEED
jgi:hypothetical protein